MRFPKTLKRAFLCKAVLLLALLFALLFAGTAVASEDDPENDLPPPEVGEADITPWHTHTMSPGETYDVGTAEKNTTVYIDAPGMYYLKGESSHCRVVIRSGGVSVYLKDGLNIDPNAYAYVGSSTAAITVEEQGGEVRLISEKNANIYLGGYYYCPAVRKEGIATKLVFETEDPSAPGTITAYRSPAPGAAAIGNAPKAINVGDCVGNIEFKSGSILATGGTNAAGIGSSVGGGGTAYLTFSGANVTATGLGAGAGIGGGYNGNAADILISGGTVKATSTGDGAGIGGGAAGSSLVGKVYTITVSGGTVTASSHSGSGIGSGAEGSVEHIVISGGIVTAASQKGTGIGGSGGNFHGRCALIDISGGTVTAESNMSNGVGIGSAVCGESGDTVINISGGRVKATGGSGGYSIGGGGKGALQDKGHCYVNISGGTVTTDPVTDGRIGSKYDLTCIITGGSFRGSVEGSVKDGSGSPVVLMNIDLHGCPEGTAVTSAVITEPASGYGMKDVITLEGLTSPDDSYSVVYPWLPKGTVTTVMGTDLFRFYGTADTDEGQGDLYRAAAVTLNANASDTGVTDGTAWAVRGEISARDVTHAVRPGYTLTGYVPMRSSRKIVLYPDGSFGKDVTGYTDTDGKWIAESSSVTFYALWQSNTCTVRFEGNVPSGTSSVLSGTMEDQTFARGTEPSLSRNAFSLPGYTFSGWNTSEDGTGTFAADQAPAAPLFAADTGTVTLYAQWTPITYSILFDPNGGSGSMAPQELTYDAPENLSLNTFIKTNAAFTGWNLNPDGTSESFSDGGQVVNLSEEADAKITLYAQWADLLLVTDPEDVTALPGEKATFSVKATGTGKLLYQWQIDRGSGWEDIPGATNPSYTTGTLKLAYSGYLYRCRVEDERMSVTTKAAALTVTDIPPTGDTGRPLLYLVSALVTGVLLFRRKRYPAATIDK